MLALALVFIVTAAVAVRRVTAAPPLPTVVVSAPSPLTPVAAATGGPATPASGSVALVVSGQRLVGGDAASRAVDQEGARVRQIGSVAKVMTALVTLEHRPLVPGDNGPVYRMDAADVALYRDDLAAGGSVVPVSVGEAFTERQLLLALLLPSGNNIAGTLARWIGGSADAFLGLLNSRAQALGMTHTHFADPAGFDDATVSTADELVLLGAAALQAPALAELVSTRTATLPDGTAITNLDSLLSTEPGWLGIKTGSTNAAGGCLLFAARRPAVGAPAGDASGTLLLVGAVLGQPQLQDALTAAARVVTATAALYHWVEPATLRPDVAGNVTAPWGAGSGVALGPSTGGAPVVLVAGQALDVAATPAPAAAPLAAGAVVGGVTVSVGGRTLATWSAVTTASLEGPDLSWRLANG